MSAGVNAMANQSVNPSAAASLRDALELRRRSQSTTADKALEPKTREAEKLHEAAVQFEAVFIRQLLKASRFAEDMGSSGYGGMALEALADGVTGQGGLGLAKAIEDTLLKSKLADLAPGGRRSP